MLIPGTGDDFEARTDAIVRDFTDRLELVTTEAESEALFNELYALTKTDVTAWGAMLHFAYGPPDDG